MLSLTSHRWIYGSEIGLLDTEEFENSLFETNRNECHQKLKKFEKNDTLKNYENCVISYFLVTFYIEFEPSVSQGPKRKFAGTYLYTTWLLSLDLLL